MPPRGIPGSLRRLADLMRLRATKIEHTFGRFGTFGCFSRAIDAVTCAPHQCRQGLPLCRAGVPRWVGQERREMAPWRHTVGCWVRTSPGCCAVAARTPASGSLSPGCRCELQTHVPAAVRAGRIGRRPPALRSCAGSLPRSCPRSSICTRSPRRRGHQSPGSPVRAQAPTRNPPLGRLVAALPKGACTLLPSGSIIDVTRQ